MIELLVATALMNPFLPGLDLGAGPDEVEAVLAENGWTSLWFGLMLRADRPGVVYESNWSEDEDEPVIICYAESHPTEETRAAAYREWLDVLREMFGEPEAAVGFHHWETERNHVHIAVEEYYVRSDYMEPSVVITITRPPKDGESSLGVEVADPFLPGLSLNEDTHTVLGALEDEGREVDTRFSYSPEGDFFILEGRREGRLLLYAYDFTEQLAEVVYVEPHPPDETRTAAYGVWLDVLKEIFGEPEVVDGFHRWDTGNYAVDIAAEPFYLRGDFPEPAVVITIVRNR